MDEETKNIITAQVAKFASENASLVKLEEEHLKRIQESQVAVNTIRINVVKNEERIKAYHELLGIQPTPIE